MPLKMNLVRRISVGFLFVLVVSTLHSCSENTSPERTNTSQAAPLLADLADSVLVLTYEDFDLNSARLVEAIGSLHQYTTNANLALCQTRWRECRLAWERCYACAIGELATDAVASAIDPWPVAYDRIDSLLLGASPLDAIALAGAEDDLNGFHAMEYVLFGANGNKQASAITTRELEYLGLLAVDIRAAASQAKESWSYGSGSFYQSFVSAGVGSPIYSTSRAALLDVVTAMRSACEDISGNNLRAAYLNANPLFDPSPFSGNALAEFAERIKTVQNIYIGKTSSAQHSISSFVAQHDATLDQQIRAALDTAIACIERIPVPYSQAITNHAQQVSNAAIAVDTVSSLLDSKLVPLIQRYY